MIRKFIPSYEKEVHSRLGSSRKRARPRRGDSASIGDFRCSSYLISEVSGYGVLEGQAGPEAKDGNERDLRRTGKRESTPVEERTSLGSSRPYSARGRGIDSEEFTPRKGTNSNRLRFGPYCLKFNPLNNRFKNPEPPAGIGLGLDRTPANNTAMGGYLLSFLYRGSSPEIYSSSSASAGSGLPTPCFSPLSPLQSHPPRLGFDHPQQKNSTTLKPPRRPARSAPLAALAAVGDSAKDHKGQLGTMLILLPGLLSLGTLLSPDTANGIDFLPSTHPLDPMPAI
uniref:Uncharacterized protein n=1 Tax=Fagus sylvatica TaxID=28930 RepID=A0A2N9G8N4_FAGSY